MKIKKTIYSMVALLALTSISHAEIGVVESSNIPTSPQKSKTVIFGDNSQSRDNIIKTMSEKGVKSRESDYDIGVPGRERILTGYDEATYEQIKRNNSLDTTPTAGNSFPMAFNVVKYQSDIDAEEEKVRQAAEAAFLAARKDKDQIRYTRGYCFLDRDIFVQRIATYAYFVCDFEEIGEARLAVSLIPEFYAKAVIANPLYITTDKNKRLPILNGVVMTKDKNSINIANIINDYLVEKIVLSSGYTGLSLFAKQAQSFLDAKSEARYSQDQSVTGGGGLNPIVSTSTRIAQPRIEDYFATATVQAVSEIAKIIGENVIKNLPYTFKINKGNVFFADVELAINGEKRMQGYKVQQANIVKKEPEFKITGKEGRPNLEKIPVLNANPNGGSSRSTSGSNASNPVQRIIEEDARKQKSSSPAQKRYLTPKKLQFPTIK